MPDKAAVQMVSYAPIVEGAMKEVLAIMQRKQEALQAGEPFDEKAEIQKHFSLKKENAKLSPGKSA
ncbi:MAG: hypothetical protein VB133_07660 [Anaeromusa sp.]|uniref:hypothetical protein n=1 Tax=Anaeromusa sp. TaxID=1872520 RepID=UPI002B20107C|nr:hypothetical protein [Anaeromusa sp.]MEA4834993.1 hypothetical protein [Anaeromusa sp.]